MRGVLDGDARGDQRVADLVCRLEVPCGPGRGSGLDLLGHVTSAAATRARLQSPATVVSAGHVLVTATTPSAGEAGGADAIASATGDAT